MAKKKANGALFKTDNAEENVEAEVPQTSETALEQLSADKVPNNIPQSVKDKLETIEALQTANSQLFQEKSDLTDKIAQYIEDVENKQKLIEEKDREIANIRAQYNILQEEYDKVLLTVSQLSYENAKLKESQHIVETSPQKEINQAPAQYTRKVSYTQQGTKRKLIPTNGYESWN